jgi:hypothetical protein
MLLTRTARPAGAVPCPSGAVAAQSGSGRSTRAVWGHVDYDVPLMPLRPISGPPGTLSNTCFAGTPPSRPDSYFNDALSHEAAVLKQRDTKWLLQLRFRGGPLQGGCVNCVKFN